MTSAVCGIYRIALFDGRCYVGQTTNTIKRWSQHRRELARGEHHSPYLQNAWTKYGATAFTFEVLEVCAPETLTQREQAWLDELMPIFNVYRIAGSPRGTRPSPEAIARRRAALTGRVFTPEHRKKLSEAARIAQRGNRNATGHIVTPEAAAKISAANKGRSAWNRGVSPSEEARQKMSAAARGRGKGQRIGNAALNVAKTHCPHGHAYADENLYVRRDGSRACVACMRARTREYKRKLRVARLALAAS